MKKIIGTPSDDVLFGSRKNDIIKGGDGRDIVLGSKGQDILSGGDEAPFIRDTFAFRSEAQADGDTIVNFDPSDIIDLSNIDANTNKKGNQSFTFLQNGQVDFTGNAGELTYKNGKVRGDTDGDGKADFKIAMENPYDDPFVYGTIQLGDFVL